MFSALADANAVDDLIRKNNALITIIREAHQAYVLKVSHIKEGNVIMYPEWYINWVEPSQNWRTFPIYHVLFYAYGHTTVWDDGDMFHV